MANLDLSQLKLQFNNDIIKLKKCFLQARLQTINKLSKKCKAIKSKQYPDDLKEKFSKKAEAIVSEINILKKLELQETIRFGVLNLENLMKFIDTPGIDQKKAFARICVHKSIKPKLQILLKKFSMVSIERLIEVNPIKVNRKKRKEKIKQKLKKSEKEKQQAENNEDEAISEEVESNSDVDNAEKIINKLKKVKNVTENKKQTIVDSEISKKVKNDTKKTINKPEKVENNAEKIINKPKKVKNMTENEKQAIVDSESGYSEEEQTQMQISDHEDEESITKEETEEVIKEEKPNKKKRTIKMLCDANTIDDNEIEKNVDPFFVTESGDKYLTLASQRPPDKLVNDQSNNRKVRRAAMFGYDVPQKKQRPQLANNTPKFDRKQLIDSANEEVLHPSWAAKKQKSQITQFQGKKVSFDNDNEAKPKSSNDEKLHPSWEARKQKKNPVAFEGKKIVFDE